MAGTVSGVSPVSGKGQVTIPKEIQDFLGVGPGDRMVFVVEDGKFVLFKDGVVKVSKPLRRQKPWPDGPLEFQRKLRSE
ncbi:MAG: AbrB/MazE/SpoVT family DNA-binding domain-containing protein [Thaumarchaeota archaeon]|nr:AbrB/MazE/SpoVT family DNA-binding domain-containing protein [Candidatus Calditenuaceae archaeon]MDW8186916.1 AbrB/MazE/SpoVT family DNA-binding domain-containing protein [Nitrososphaerota archaeon]